MENFTIEYGNIVDDKFLAWCDIIVNSTNPLMKNGSGICGAIFAKAGCEELESYTEKAYGLSFENRENAMKPTEIRITPGFRMPCDIMFAQGPKAWDYEFDRAFALLLKTYENILNVAYEKGYRRVLLSAMGTGHYGFTHEETARSVVRCIKEFLKTHAEFFVKLVLQDEATAEFYKKTETGE